MLSEERGDCTQLEIKMDKIDDSGDIRDHDENIKHAARPTHIFTHEYWIRNKRREKIEDGNELLRRRKVLFPSLTFCTDVKDTLPRLRRGSPEFGQILNKLFLLFDYCQEWTSGPFTGDGLPKCTPESPGTMNRYENEHTFFTATGEAVVCSWHLRFTPGAGRIYFRPNPDSHTIIIGHIGGKLPTVTNPNR